ncbi:hypothetical protein quinque_016205 [Culex quinquefasciatus]
MSSGSHPAGQLPLNHQAKSATTVIHLPPKIWEHIFRFIPGFQLLRLRLICRTWNDVISGSLSLMDRFHFRIIGRGRQERMTREYVPPGLHPMVTKVLVRNFGIDGVGTWFQNIAPKLTELQLIECDLSVEVLFEMLRQVPRLKKLILFYSRFTGSGEPDFRLEQLQSLMLNNVSYGADGGRHILDGFDRIFPRLSDLGIATDIESRKVEVLEWIRTIQVDLRNLQLPREPYIMEGLCQLKELRLELVSLNAIFPDDLELWTRFCRMQPHVEILTITTNDAEILAETGRLLPKLRHLALIVPGPVEVSFLGTMPHLKYLEISGILHFSFDQVSFLNHSCPNLEQFALKNAATDDLFQFLRRSPKLTRMNLTDCDLDCFEAVPGNFPSLNFLILDSVDYPNYLMDTFLCRCPVLEELHLFGLRHLDDDVVRKFCSKLKRLKKLSLTSNRCVTDESARYIMKHCSVLEELSADFSDAVLNRIETTRRNIRVKRRE